MESPLPVPLQLPSAGESAILNGYRKGARQVQYYKAYDARYETVHAAGLAWFGGGVTPAVAALAERLPAGARVLEIGCGEGADAMFLLSRGFDVLATDVSPAAVGWCRQKFPDHAECFRVLDALADPLEERFDAVVAVAVLHMLTEDADRARLLAFIRDHLKTGGTGLVVVMGDGEAAFATDPAQAYDVQERVHQPSGRSVCIASTSCRVVSCGDFHQELRQAGLIITESGATQWDGSDFAMYAIVGRAERPMHDMLTAARDRRRFHMPGHKGRAPFTPEDLSALDTTETPETDDLYAPENGILRAQELYAKAAGAGATILIHNGSTAGIHAMVQLYAREGDTVLLPRNAHLSAANGCILGGVEVVWMPVTQREDGYCYIKEETVLDAIAAHPEAKAVLLTRPDYYGGCISLARIAKAAHAAGMHLVVDEAHGAHLPWLAGLDSAGACGADAWVQSVHKTLPGLTGSAALHLADAADRGAAMRILRREQTSSPSFILLQSVDDARAWMEVCGTARLAQIAQAAEDFRAALADTPYADAHGAWRDTGLAFDPTRLVIAAPQGGAALSAALAERGFDVEMHDHRRVVLILSAMDTPEDLAALMAALKEIPAEEAALPPVSGIAALPPRRAGLREAALCEGEEVPVEKSAGRVAAASAGLYPPGIPLVCPGEEVTPEVAAMLSAAGERERFGLMGGTLLCMR